MVTLRWLQDSFFRLNFVVPDGLALRLKRSSTMFDHANENVDSSSRRKASERKRLERYEDTVCRLKHASALRCTLCGRMSSNVRRRMHHGVNMAKSLGS